MSSNSHYNRRTFLKYATLASASGLFGAGAHFELNQLAQAQIGRRPKRMVVIFLRGGNGRVERCHSVPRRKLL